MTGEVSAVLTDKGWGSRASRRRLGARGCEPVIPPRAGTACPPGCGEDARKDRDLIERASAHLEDCRRVATRIGLPGPRAGNKLVRGFEAALAITVMRRWLMI